MRRVGRGSQPIQRGCAPVSSRAKVMMAPRTIEARALRMNRPGLMRRSSDFPQAAAHAVHQPLQVRDAAQQLERLGPQHEVVVECANRIQPLVKNIEDYLLVPMLRKLYKMMSFHLGMYDKVPAKQNGVVQWVEGWKFQRPCDFQMLASSKMLAKATLSPDEAVADNVAVVPVY